MYILTYTKLLNETPDQCGDAKGATQLGSGMFSAFNVCLTGLMTSCRERRFTINPIPLYME